MSNNFNQYEGATSSKRKRPITINSHKKTIKHHLPMFIPIVIFAITILCCFQQYEKDGKLSTMIFPTIFMSLIAIGMFGGFLKSMSEASKNKGCTIYVVKPTTMKTEYRYSNHHHKYLIGVLYFQHPEEQIVIPKDIPLTKFEKLNSDSKFYFVNYNSGLYDIFSENEYYVQEKDRTLIKYKC